MKTPPTPYSIPDGSEFRTMIKPILDLDTIDQEFKSLQRRDSHKWIGFIESQMAKGPDYIPPNPPLSRPLIDS